MYAEVAWLLVTSGTQAQPQVIFNSDYLPDYLSVSYGYDKTNFACYVDDNTPHVAGDSIDGTSKSTEHDSMNFFKRFLTNECKQVVIDVILSQVNKVG